MVNREIDDYEYWSARLEEHPDSVQALVGLASATLRRGDANTEDAIRLVQKALLAEPDNALANLLLGDAVVRKAVQTNSKQDYEDARQAYSKALVDDALAEHCYCSLAYIANARGDRLSAIDNLERAFALDPSNYDTSISLGILLARSGRFISVWRVFKAYMNSK